MTLPINYNTATPRERREAREEYVRQQNGLCHYCGESLDKPAPRYKPINHQLFPKGFFRWPVHLHHDHHTGMTIGAVHNYCNAILWQYHGE